MKIEKVKRIAIVLLSIAIIVSMILPSMYVFADDEVVPQTEMDAETGFAVDASTEEDVSIDEDVTLEEENRESEDLEQKDTDLDLQETVNGVTISVKGHFASPGMLSVKRVKQKTLSEDNVAKAYSFDIKVLNEDGEEMQPEGDVDISFEFQKISTNLDVAVYHEKKEIESEVVGDSVNLTSDGFSVYTVEFTYEDKEYVLEGDSYVKLSDILSEIGLSGEVSSYEVSNSDLFDIFKGNEEGLEYVETYDEEGNLLEYYPKNKGSVLYMVALQPFTSEEWLKVIIDNIEYTIIVTDAIRTDENGDQVGTNVRFMQESTAIGTITDSRVIQGPLEDNFTASMPLAEIYIDDTIVNQTLWSKDEYNGTRVIAELLVDNTQGKYAGFQINTDTSAVSADKGTLQNSYGGVWYDFTKRYLNDTQYLTVSGSSANNYELFSGDIVKYTLKGMATKFDVASNSYKNYDVVITYSDILITLCQNSGTGAVNQANISSILKLIDTNMVNFTWSGGFRAGLSYNVNVKVVDPDTGALIDGSYYYPMTDIDIGRTGIGGFANLYNASNLNRYSEQVALMSNYGRPTSSGSWEQMMWIPGGNYSAAPFTNKANVTEDNYPYTCNIASKTIDGQANTLLISPGGTTTAVSGKITSASGVNKDNTFYSGFITLANNTAGGINIKGYASAPASGGVESYVLTGSQIVNHKVDASSDVGGTIFTTTTGNSDGSLSGGTLLGYNEVNKPFEISAATGQSVTYTMTPKGGYKLKNVWVKDGDIDIMTIINTAKGTVLESTFDTNNDGKLDETERLAYENAIQTAINTALANDTNTNSISISNLTSLGKGVYTYTFSGIQEDKSIHIEWEKTDLTVTKELSPTMSGITDKFKFQIKLSDTSTEETTWRVKAKKNTGKIDYRNPYFQDHVNTTYYFGYHEGHEETLPYSYVEVTETEEKNPYEEGWYIYYNGSYMPSYDTTVDESTIYYERDNTQTSTVTNYYYHLLGWNESTNSWEDKVVPATNSSSGGAVLGTENLDTELPDYYRYNYDETVVNNENYYNEETDTYDKYLMWIPDDTTGKQILVVGNAEEHPNGTPFSMSDYYAYIYQEGIENYSGKVLKGEPIDVDINGVSYETNFGGTGYWYIQDDTMPIYYNLINNSNEYNLDSGYTPLEGESGMYIITLPAGQTPNTDDLTANGWDVTVSRVGAIEDNFDLDKAMDDAGAKSVAGAVNTYEFDLGVDETIDFNGVIPMGWNYEITEILPSNSIWEKVSNTPNATISDFDGEEAVGFVNQKKLYDLTINKETVDNAPGNFEFKVKVWHEQVIPSETEGEEPTIQKTPMNLSNQFGLPDADGYYHFNLSNGGSIKIEDILYGYHYEVIEVPQDGWSLENSENTTGVMSKDSVVTFTNKKDISLTVKKETDEETDERFEFRVKVWTYGLPESGGGEKGIVKVEDMQQKIQFPISEVPGINASTTTTLEILTETPDSLVEIWDAYELLQNYGDETGPIYSIITEDNIQPKYRKTANDAGIADFGRVDKGYYFVRVTATSEEQPLEFQWLAMIPEWDGEAWNYNAALSVIPQPLAREYDSLQGLNPTSTEGEYAFSLKSGEELTIPNIPYGHYYEVYEVDSNGNQVSIGSLFNNKWVLESATKSSGILDEKKTATFRNIVKKGTIDVEKETKGDEVGEFNFKIRLKKPGVNEQEPPGDTMFFIGPKFKGLLSKNIRGSLSWDSVTIDDNKVSEGIWEYSFKLNNGENLSFTDIPYGTEYEVWEETPEGWELISIDGVTPRDKVEGTVNKDSVEHVFLNAKKKTLIFGKEVTGGFGDKDKEFEFEVKVYNETQTIDLTSYGGVDNDNGIYTFKLKHGETVTIPDIPYGYTYEVKEKDYTSDQYTTKVDGASGRIATGTLTEDKEHEFTNNREGVVPTGVLNNSPKLFIALLVLSSIAVMIFLKRRLKCDK